MTGGAGFLGANLVDRLLAEGYDVEVADDLSHGTLANLSEARGQRSRRFSFHRIDVWSTAIAELLAHRRPELVFHLAATGDARASVKRPALDAEVNVMGSLQVILGALAAGCRKVVFASSGAAIYGPSEELPIREGHPQRPETPHGVAKKTVHDYLAVFRQLHGLEYTALALGNVYGPRQDPEGESGVVASFAGRMLRRERPTIHGDGSQSRDFVFVDDAVDAFVRAAEKGSGLLVNVGTGMETTVASLYETMARLTGFTEEARHAPARVGEIGRCALDPGRAAIHLGWKPWTSLDDGLRRTIDWYRAAKR